MIGRELGRLWIRGLARVPVFGLDRSGKLFAHSLDAIRDGVAMLSADDGPAGAEAFECGLCLGFAHASEAAS